MFKWIIFYMCSVKWNDKKGIRFVYLNLSVLKIR